MWHAYMLREFTVEVVLRHFHWHCYKSSPDVVLYWRGLKSLWLAMDDHGEH
jgi:hypothetical protein